MDLGYMCLQTLYCWIMKADSWWIVLCAETVNWAANVYTRLLSAALSFQAGGSRSIQVDTRQILECSV